MDHRRGHLRFEILGRLAGSIVSTEILRVLNLGASGALVEAALPLAPNAEYRMQLVLESHVSEVTVKVRRINEIAVPAGASRYRIGLEFLALGSDAEDAIHRLVLANQAGI